MEISFLKYLILFSILSFGTLIKAQISPAPPQQQAILLKGATAHLGNGEVIQNSWVGFENGKIIWIADAETTASPNDKKWKTINVEGKHLYPGFIAPNTQLGLIEIEAVRATRDARELGSLNPHLRSIVAYNTDSQVTPTVRSNGVLLAQIVPEGGTIAGTSSIVSLDAWNWEDAAYKMDDAIHLHWPSAMTWTGWREGNPRRIKNKKYGENVRQIEDMLVQAVAYSKGKNRKTNNLILSSMTGLFDGSQQLYIHVNDAEGIASAISLKDKYPIDIVIVGGKDSYLLTDLLKAKSIPVILYPTHSLPHRVDDDVDQSYKLPVQLHEAGILYAIGGTGFWTQRNLPFYAGQAVGYGLPYEAAITALTLNTAKILGIDKTVGSIELGKDATLIISQGDVLDMRSSIIEMAYINGKAIDLDNKQKQLARKFREKYQR